jgi:hypothetical protein
VKKLLVGIGLIASLTLSIISPAKAAFVGLHGWNYLEQCATSTDSDCIDSVAFSMPGHDYGVVAPTGTGGDKGVNIFYTYKLDGYNGPDGTDTIRIESRIENGNVVRTLIGGVGNSEPNPRPSICDTNPAANAVCKVLGDIDPNLVITVTLRLKTVNPGITQGTIDKANIAITPESYGHRVVVSAQALRYMGYIRWAGMPNIDQTTASHGDFISHVWNFYIYDTSMGPFGGCNSAGSAFVGANAENSGFPTFNKSDKTLQMKTSSSHFEPDGATAFKGQYFARLSAALVKCVWGLDVSTASTKAEIQIVSNGSDNSVASVISNYQDGWLKIDARNYEYSSPTIKVKLTQDKPAPVATPTPAVTPIPVASEIPTPAPLPAPKISAVVKKSTITCIKGKSIKSFTAIKPTCPAGYTKK